MEFYAVAKKKKNYDYFFTLVTADRTVMYYVFATCMGL